MVAYPNMFNFGFYISSLSLYYFLEYLFVSRFHPKEAGVESFLIFHSFEYMTALSCSMVEFLVEYYFFPNLKFNYLIVGVGIIGIIIGQSFRTFAQWTAGYNFHHIIQEKKKDEHVLVTNGVYSISRHPAYMGWFWWSVSTQILLLNPFSIVLFTSLAWKFFAERIPEEESFLIKFFGRTYEEYRRRVFVGIPFIK